MTWDGAGNLTPILALVDALVSRGHVVEVLAHDVQKAKIEAAGGKFLAFGSARQIDQGCSQSFGENPFDELREIDLGICRDFLPVYESRVPDALLIDCMLPDTLRAAKRTGKPTVALVHSLYSVFAVFAGGVFRGPIDEADLALGFTYAALDDAAAVQPNFVFVGPARPQVSAGSWVRQKPNLPFVVASLSTGLQGKPGTQHALLQRLCDALAPLAIEALVTTGRGIEPESVVPGPSTKVARFVPHELVLPHADLFITHAGHGSITASLAAGVPMLCLPPGGDQPYNAARIAQLGYGETLDTNAPSTLISETVTRMLGDTNLRQRTRDFASVAAKLPGINLVVTRIERLVTECPARVGS